MEERDKFSSVGSPQGEGKELGKFNKKGGRWMKISLKLIALVALLGFVAFGAMSYAQNPSITLNPTQGTVGEMLTVEGSNFDPNTVIGNLTFGGITITRSLHNLSGDIEGDAVKTKSDGTFSVSFIVPEHTGGTVQVKVFGVTANYTLNEKIESVSPTVVHVGDSISVKVTGLKADTNYKIRIGKKDDGNPQETGDFKPGGNGSKTISATVGNLPFDRNLVDNVVELRLSGNTIATYPIYIIPKLVKPDQVKHYKRNGDPVTVVGKGFKANTSVTVKVGAQSYTASTDNKGYFSIDCQITEDQPWKSSITVKATVSDYGVYSGDYPAPSAIVIDPTIEVFAKVGNNWVDASGQVLTIGDELKVVGHNFYWLDKDHKDSVSIYVESESVASATATSDGTFEKTFSLKAFPQSGYFTVKARGSVSATDATYTILYSSPVTSERVILSKSSGAPGSTIKVTGVGFDPNTDLGYIQFGSLGPENRMKKPDGTDATAMTDENGSFGPVEVVIPDNIPGGARNIFTSERPDVRATFTVTPSISITYVSIHVGEALTITKIKGFSPNEDVSIRIAGVEAAKVKVDGNGVKESFTVTVPELPYGKKNVTAYGLTSLTSASKDDAIKIVNSISANPGPSTVRVGDSITVTGKGWAANGSIKITFGGVTVWEGNANDKGSFPKSFNVPYIAQASNTVDLVVEGGGVDSGDKTKTLSGYTVVSRSTDEPIAGLSKSEGVVGEEITVYGFDVTGDFGDLRFDDTLIPVDVNNDGVADWTDTDGDGVVDPGEQPNVTGFPIRFWVPTVPGGRHYIRLANSSVPFDVKGSITSYPTGDQKVGDKIEIKVKGFNGTVDIYIGGVLARSGQSLGGDGTADIKDIVIPQIPFGRAKIKVVGSAGGGTVEVDGPFIVPKITLTPSSGYNGTEVTIKGYGFKAGENVRLEMNGSYIGSDVTDNTGYFEYTKKIENQPAGTKTFSARGLLSYTERPQVYPVTASFTVHGSIKSISKLSGPYGTEVSVTIEGYGTNQNAVSVNFGGTDITPTFDAGTDSTIGKYVLKFTVPNVRHGSTVVTIADNSERNIFTFGVTSKISAPSTVYVGDKITVEGWGFEPGSVTIDYAGHTGIATASVNDSGYFKAENVQIPATPYGNHDLVARQAATSAKKTVKVERKISKSVTSYEHGTGNKTQVYVGETLNVQGTGFEANISLNVKFGGKKLSGVSNAVTDANGSFSLSFVVPDVVYGNYETRIYYDDWKDDKSISAGTLEIKPFITVSDSTTGTGVPTGKSGSVITIEGKGFPSGDGKLYYAGVEIADIRADGNGDFTKTITMQPNLPIGRYDITATIGGRSASKAFIYSGGGPTLYASTGEATPGQKIKIYGTGYSPGASLGQVKFGGITVSSDITANANGAFEVEITVPDVTYGSKSVTLSAASGSTNVTVKPVISISPDKGFVGTRIYVTGKGYEPGKDITLRFDGSTVVPGSTYDLKDEGAGSLRYEDSTYKAIRSDGNGVFQVSFKVPAKFKGGKTVEASFESGSASKTFTVEPRIISVSPSNVYYGTSLRVKADGLPQPTSSVELIFGSQSQAFTTGDIVNGSFDKTVTIGDQKYGSKTVKIKVDGAEVKDSAGNTITGSFQMRPSLTVSRVTDTRGDKTKFNYTGHGFSKGDVHVVLGSKDIKVSAGDNGAFTGTSDEIGSQPGGTVQVRATGSSGESASAYLTILPRIEIYKKSETTYYVGTSVRVKGYGFIPGENVGIYEAGTLRTSTTANGSGEIDVPFPVPDGAYGNRSVRAIGQFSSNDESYAVHPKITAVSPTTGYKGTPVRVQGNGLMHGQAYTLSLPGAPSITDNLGDGKFDVTFNLGDAAEGPMDVTLGGYTYPQKFVYSKAATAYQNVGRILAEGTNFQIGKEVKVRGYSFPANYNVGNLKLGERIITGLTDIGAGQVIFDQITTDGNGAFEVKFTVPDLPGGSYSISVTNITPAQVGSINVVPSISLSPSSGPNDVWIRVEGKGYQPNQEIGRIKFAGANVDDIRSAGVGSVSDKKVKVNSAGKFAVEIKVPYKPEGKYTVSDQNDLASAEFKETGHATIVKLSPSTVHVGDILTIGVQGFPANVTLKAKIGGVDVTGATSGGDGKREWTVVVPVIAGGSQTVRVWTEASNTDKQSTESTITIVPKITSVNPLSGVKGDTIDVTGTGFGASEQLTVWLDDQQVPNALSSARSDGTFLVSFTVPDHPYGNATITVKGHTGAQASYPVYFKVNSKISVTPVKDNQLKGTYADGPVTIVGSGFIAGDNLTVKFTGATSQTVQVADDGSFTAQFDLAEITRGAKTISVESPTNDDTNRSTTFTVEPYLRLSPSSALPGADVVVEGYGFDPGGPYSTVTLKVDTQTVATNIDVSSGGHFGPVTITVPSMAPHDAYVHAYQAGIEIKSEKLVIQPGAGEITVDPTSGNIGTQVSVTAPAATFKAGEAVDLYFAGSKMLTKGAGNDGSFSASFTVPEGIPGGVKVVEARSETVSKQANFTLNPKITGFSPTEATIGSIVTVTGNGMGANDTLTVEFGESEDKMESVTILSGGTANADGTFEIRFAIPDRAYSQASFDTLINIKGSPSGLETGNVSFVTVRIETSRLVVTPTEGPVDTDVTIYGMIVGASGAKANENIGELRLSSFGTTISVDLAGHPDWVTEGSLSGNELVTNSNGRFKVQFKLSDAVAGTNLALIGGQSVTITLGKVANLSAVFTVKAIVAVSPTEATVGQDITVTGSGYMPSTDASIKLDGTEIGTATADSSGGISATVTVPEGVLGGDHNVTVVQTIGVLTIQSAEPATLTVKGQITKIEPASTIAGAKVTVEGNGFGSSEALQFKIDTQDIPSESVTNGTTTETGTFAATVTLPSDLAEGTYTLTVTGATSEIEATGSIQIITATATATPTEGEVGDTVTVEGAGFPANTAVEFYFGTVADENKVTPETAVTTDDTGAFTATITIPKAFDDGTKLLVKVADIAVETNFAYKSLIKSVTVEITNAAEDGTAIKDSVITVTATLNRSVASGTFSIGDLVTDAEMSKVEGATEETWQGTYTVKTGDYAKDAVVSVKMTSASGKVSTAEAADKVNVDATVQITSADVSATTVKNGDTITFTVVTEPEATVTVDLGGLDSTVTEPIALTESTETPGTFTANVTISAENSAPNGTYTAIVKAVDKYGNEATSEISIELKNTVEFTLQVGGGLSLVSVPLKLDTPMKLSELASAIGNVTSVIRIDENGKFVASVETPQGWLNDTDLVGGESLLIIRPKDATAAQVKFTGKALDGIVKFNQGLNLITVPLKPAQDMTLEDLYQKLGGDEKLAVLIWSQNGTLKSDPTKRSLVKVVGGASYLIFAKAAGEATFEGTAWENQPEGAASPYLSAADMDTSSAPVLIVSGSVRDESGVALKEIKVTVENLTASRNVQTVVDETGRYAAVLVDLGGKAVKAGDMIRIDAIDPSGRFVAEPVKHLVTEEDIARGSVLVTNLTMKPVPKATALLPNYPNPFNPETWIPFMLSREADVTIRIYDSLGRLVRTIDLGHLRPGYYLNRDRAAYWDGRNELGEQVASGVYFYQIQAGSFVKTKRMVLLK